jgi:hypothetical protein
MMSKNRFMKAYRGNGGNAQSILSLDIKLMSVHVELDILLQHILIPDVESGSKSAERNITATVGLVVHAAGKDQHVIIA